MNDRARPVAHTAKAREDVMENESIVALTISEFCTANRLGRTFVYSEIKAGRLSAVKAGTKTLILKSEALRWLRSLPQLHKAAT